MSTEVEKRLAEVAPAYNALVGAWPHVAAELARIRAQHVEALVSENSEELRGRIKQIDDLLFLPHSLRQEMQNLSESLPRAGDS